MPLDNDELKFAADLLSEIFSDDNEAEPWKEDDIVFTTPHVLMNNPPPLAFLLLQSGPKGWRILFNWHPPLFEGKGMPDKLRAAIVERLRAEADRLERKEVDKRVRDVMGYGGTDKPGGNWHEA